MRLPILFSQLSLLPLSHPLALPPQTPFSSSSSSASLLSSPPLLGYGTWNLEKHNASAAVAFALKTGYRHIDCAAAYGNEKEVGAGIARGLKDAGVKREEVWVTSKLWNDQ
jgi:alcohol dehydrogenase (NADP+)